MSTPVGFPSWLGPISWSGRRHGGHGGGTDDVNGRTLSAPDLVKERARQLGQEAGRNSG